MDPRYTFRKGYDTDLLILRSLFALDSNTNLPISSFYTGVADGIGGIQWLSLTQYFSAGTGILNFVSSVESFSTVTGLYSNFSTQAFSNFYTQNLTASTISCFTISTQNIRLSSLTFMDVKDNTTNTLNFSSGTMYLNGNIFYGPNTVTTSTLVSTVRGLGTAGYISSSQLLSTVNGLSNIFVNTGSLVSTTAALTNTILSTSAGLGTTITLTSNTLSSNINTNGSNTSNYAAGLVTTASNALQSNITLTSNTLTTLVQTSIVSTTVAVGIPIQAFPSTVAGLGTAGYISSSYFNSVINGLGTIGYISSSQLQSSLVGLGGSGVITIGQLTSSIIGLGTVGYISSAQLQSTVIGLGGVGLVSTGQLVSTTIGLSNLILPASGVSQSQLVSTTSNLNDNFYVANASQVFINNSRVTISSVGTFIYFSTFMNSSITYQGNMGQINASNAAGPTAPFYFSSAILNIDRWSSFINAQSIITVEAYPNFFFGNLGLPAANPVLIYMSSFIQSGNLFLSSQMAQSAIYPTIYDNNRSNSFYQPIKISVPGAAIQGLYPNSMRLAHYLPNAYTVGVTQGFGNSNVSIYFGSTNSLFLSIQNLPL
jgi:hypothetical protein